MVAEPVEEIPPGEILRHHILAAVVDCGCHDPFVQNLDNMQMSISSRRRHFLGESFHRFRVMKHVGLQDLDRDGTVEFRRMRAVHASESPATEIGLNNVAVDLRPILGLRRIKISMILAGFTQRPGTHFRKQVG